MWFALDGHPAPAGAAVFASILAERLLAIPAFRAALAPDRR
jgi:hypothetical protein